MSKVKLSGKQIRALGYPEGPVVSVAMHTMSTGYKHNSEEEALDTLSKILANPQEYLTHPILSKIAEKLIVKEEMESQTVALKAEGIPYKIFGA